jgi:(p)ppGpp synthase/HD superfamily hydrolase
MNRMLVRAIEYANTAHADQTRRNGIPYIVHPVAVMALLGQWGVKDEEVLTVAVLHDLVEDAGVTVKSIERLFSQSVAILVYHLTHKDAVPKKEYIASFARADVPIEALLVKLADRICNVNDFIYEDPEYAPNYAHKGRPIFEAFQSRRQEIEERFEPDIAKNAFHAWGRMMEAVNNLNSVEK